MSRCAIRANLRTLRSASTQGSSAAQAKARSPAERASAAGARERAAKFHLSMADERRQTAAEAPEPPSAAWSAALQALADDLRRRDLAARTARAYGSDLRDFARWASAEGREPGQIGPKDVRRYIAHLSALGAAPATSARKLAALRALFASQRERGFIAQNPADLVSTPRRPRHLPRVLSAREAARLLDGIPAGSALEQRDRAMFELAY